MKTRTGTLALGALLALSSPAFAHLDPAEHGSFLAGATHPLFGADHVLAMVAVGLWAALLGGRAVLIVPTAFVAAMALGFLLSMAGVPLPFVEPAILASVVAIGLLVAMAVRIPALACAALVGAFALFHGHAHGGEIGDAGALAYLLGFAASTALLHLGGVGVGYGLGRVGGTLSTRLLGAATAASGLYLMVAA